MPIKGVEARAFSLPQIIGLQGRPVIPVVVSAKQAQTPVERDEEVLVGVGTGVLQAGGGPDLGGTSFGIKKERSHQEPIKTFPTRIVYAVDISSSMAEPSGASDGSSKLKHVQDTISGFAKAIPLDIEHVLIQYDDKCNIVLRTKDASALVREIKSLITRDSTNIYAPIEMTLGEIGDDKDTRNGIVLITDGQITSGPGRNQVIDISRGLPGKNCFGYMVGVGPHYDEDLLRGILVAIKFGGMTHLPLEQGGINIFQPGDEPKGIPEGILPKVIKQVRSAPHFVEISYNNRFTDGVFNVTPSVREVVEEKYQRSVADLISGASPLQINYPAAMGYLYKDYSVGFAPEDAVSGDKAKVHLIVRESSSGNPLLVKEINIEPLQDAILDPRERTLVVRTANDALMEHIAAQRNADLIQQFLDNNPNLDNRFRELLEGMRDNLRKPHRTYQDEADFRGDMTELGTAHTQLSFVDKSPPAGRGDTEVAGQSHTIVGTSPAKVHNVPEAKSPGGTDLASEQPITLSLTKEKGPATIEVSDTVSDGSGSIVLHDGDQIKIGREKPCETILKGDKQVSYEHCLLIYENGILYGKDLGSSNGTFLNNKKQHSKFEIQDNDHLRIGRNTIRISIK